MHALFTASCYWNENDGSKKKFQTHFINYFWNNNKKINKNEKQKITQIPFWVNPVEHCCQELLDFVDLGNQ